MEVVGAQAAGTAEALESEEFELLAVFEDGFVFDLANSSFFDIKETLEFIELLAAFEVVFIIDLVNSLSFDIISYFVFAGSNMIGGLSLSMVEVAFGFLGIQTFTLFPGEPSGQTKR
jgi:hypothetical protein